MVMYNIDYDKLPPTCCFSRHISGFAYFHNQFLYIDTRHCGCMFQPDYLEHKRIYAVTYTQRRQPYMVLNPIAGPRNLVEPGFVILSSMTGEQDPRTI